MSKFTNKLTGALKSRGLSSATLTAVVIAVVMVFNALIYAVTSLFGLYIYTPETDDLSLSGNTDQLFAKAIERGKKVTVTFLMTEEELEVHDTGSFVYKTAKGFEERYGEFIELNYINFLTHRDEEGNLVDLNKYKKDMRGEDTTLRSSTVIFSSGESYRVLTDMSTSVGFSDFFSLDSRGSAYAYIGEEVLASMISWVLNDEHKTAYLTQNHGETAEFAFSNVLACAGYYVDVINLRQQEVPDDAGMVIISNPITDFEKGAEGSTVRAEIERLNTYLEKGGNLYVSVDPYTRRLPVLENFLAEWGIVLRGAELEDGYYREIVKDSDNAITMDGLSFVCELAEDNLAKTVAADVTHYGTGSVVLREVSALELSGNARPMLLASPSSVTMTGAEVADDSGSFVVAAYSERQEESGIYSHVFVVPSLFLTNSDALATDNYSNKDFLYATFNHLFDSVSAPYGCKSIVYETGLLQNLTMGTARAYTAILMAIPVVLAVFGGVMIIRRKYR